MHRVLLPIDVAIVDPDLLWRVEHMNAVRHGLTKEFGTLGDAEAVLEPGYPAWVVIGPSHPRSPSTEDWGEVEGMHRRRPEIRFLVFADEIPDDSLLPDLESWVTFVAKDLAVTEFSARLEHLRPERDPERSVGGSDADGTIAEEADQPLVLPDNVLVVTSAKGGEGVTTVAANLAAALVRSTGLRVALVDADPTFGDVGLLLGQPPSSQLLVRDLPLDADTIANLMSVDEGSGLLLAQAPHLPDALEGATGKVLLALLRAVRERADVIVVDAPFPTVLSTLRHAFAVLIVTETATANLKNAFVASNELGPSVRAFAVLNQVHPLTYDRDLRTLGAAIGLPVLACVPHDRKLHRAAGATKPGVLADPGSMFGRVIEHIARELTTQTPLLV